MTVFCNQCGAAMPRGAKFCSKCGATLSTVVPPLPPAQKIRETRKGRSSPSLSSWLGTLRGHIDPNHLERGKAKEKMDEARNLRVDFANMVGEAYRIYLSGDSKEALKVFVSAARIEMEATRIEKEAEEIFIGLGYYSIDDN